MGRELTFKEDDLIRRLSNGEEYTYHTYVFYVEGKLKLQHIKEKYFNIIKEYPFLRTIYAKDEQGFYVAQEDENMENAFQIRDVEAFDDASKFAYISSIIASARRGTYNCETMYLTTMNLFNIKDSAYVCVLSFCDALSKSLSALMFLSKLGLHVYRPEERELPNDKARHYYSQLIGNSPKSISMGRSLKQKDFIKESFEVDKELVDIVRGDFFHDYSVLRCMFICVWGIVISRAFGMEEVISADIESVSRHFSVSLTKQRKSADFKTALIETIEQTKKIREYPEISRDDFRHIVGGNVSDAVSILHDFTEYVKPVVNIKDVEEGGVIELFAEMVTSAAINIKYKFGVDKSRVEYRYEKDIFANVSIKDLHDSVMKSLCMILRKIYIENAENKDAINNTADINIDKCIDAKNGQNANANRILGAKMTVINTIGVFRECTNTEKEYISNNSIIRTYMMGENIILPNIIYDSINIIVMGKVANERLDNENYIKPIQILKEGEMFGFESMFEPYKSKDIYSAVSDQAIIMTIPVPVLKTVYAKHPEILIEFMKMIDVRLDKFKRLWILG